MRVLNDKPVDIDESQWPQYQPQIRTFHQAETSRHRPFHLWKAARISPRTEVRQVKQGIDPRYNCYGYATGTFALLGGPYSPSYYGLELLLEDDYQAIKSSHIDTDDVLVWRGELNKIVHAARVHLVCRDEKGRLSGNTVLRSKNGARLFKERTTLNELCEKYGRSLNAYRQLAPVNEDDEGNNKINFY